MPWYGTGSWVTGHAGQGSVYWWVTLAGPKNSVVCKSSFPFLPSPPFPLPFPFLPFPLLFPPLRSSTPIAARGFGERSSSPSGSGRSPAAKRILTHFRPKFAPFWVPNAAYCSVREDKLCPPLLSKSSFAPSNSSVGTQKGFLRLCTWVTGHRMWPIVSSANYGS